MKLMGMNVPVKKIAGQDNADIIQPPGCKEDDPGRSDFSWKTNARLIGNKEIKRIIDKIIDTPFLHAKPWIPGSEKSIFTVVIH